MIWAIVNRYYRKIEVKAVSFPVHHLGRASDKPQLDSEKVQGEIVGSALYAGLTEFLGTRLEHSLDFSSQDGDEILRLSNEHRLRRLRSLRQNIARTVGLRESIRAVVRDGELIDLLHHLDNWFTPALFEEIRDGVQATCARELATFLMSLRAVVDDYASITINTNFIRVQLRPATGL